MDEYDPSRNRILLRTEPHHVLDAVTDRESRTEKKDGGGSTLLSMTVGTLLPLFNG